MSVYQRVQYNPVHSFVIHRPATDRRRVINTHTHKHAQTHTNNIIPPVAAHRTEPRGMYISHKKKSRVHPSPRIERLHDRRDLSEEPRLRVLVRDLHELILVLPRLVREPDPAVFDRHALDEREGKLRGK